MKPQKHPYPETLQREKLLYNILCEALAERLFFYFRGTVDFDYDDNGDGAFVECNLHLLFSTFCLSCESATKTHIHISARGEMCEITFTVPEGTRLDEKQIFENASLGAMSYERRENGFTLSLPISYEAVLPLFASHERLTEKLDALAKMFGIL